MIASDDSRHRLVEVGRHGETHEYDGTQWLLRPGPGPRGFGRICQRTAVRRLFAFVQNGLSETWEFDGAVWQKLNPSPQPPPRTDFAMAYDLLRDRVVVFGGNGNSTVQGDTWEWDGSVWSQRASSGPQPRVRPVMSFDSARGVSVLFGGAASGIGSLGDTWEWNGTTWLQRTPASSPTARDQHGMAYDPLRARTVLYGGFDQSGVQNDLWEYDGNTWRSVPFLAGPGPRWHHDLVFDSALGETLLVAGATPSAVTGDVWRWNGARWLQVTTTPMLPDLGQAVGAAAEPVGGGVLVFGGILSAATWRYTGANWTRMAAVPAPAPRMEPAMWTDGSNAWLFGGSNSRTGAYFTDTWLWTGTGWQSHTSGLQPPPRDSARVAFDSVRGRAVLFGGFSGSSGVLGDTWTWDGITWQRQTPAVSPPARGEHAMAFDPGRARVVLFGGTNVAVVPVNDTWEWDGVNWAAINTPARPPAYGGAAMHYDVQRANMLLTTTPNSGSTIPTLIEAWSYDGVTWTPVPLLEPRVAAFRHSIVPDPATGALLVVDGGSVLEFVHGPATAVRQGTDCGPLSPRLSAREYPSPGNARFGLDVAGAPPLGAVVIGGSTAATSVPIGNCTLLVSPPLVVMVQQANSSGFATQPIPVPAQPVLLGVQWFFQAATLQPAAPSGFTFSAALRVVVGG
jgi:hypothetical protein